jgi:hypothetical protein
MTFDVKTPSPNNETKYFALLWDCGTDGRVTSDLKDQYASLTSSGYTAILALRDVRPEFVLSDVPRMKAGFQSVLPKEPITPQLILAALEIEAWFIADHTHFGRIDPMLTPTHIQNAFGVDVTSAPIELIAEPATLLTNVYALAGATYTKSAADATRTVKALDLQLLLDELPMRAPNFSPLKRALRDFFSPWWVKLRTRFACRW